MSSPLDSHRERFRANPGDRRAFEALEEHLFVAGDWEELVAHYEHRLTLAELAPRERARIHFRLGQVWADRKKDIDRALEAYRQAVAADPACRAALTELRRLHAERGQWDMALQIAEAELALPMSSEERAALLADVGTLWLDCLFEPEQALAQFESALEQAPAHEMALDGAARANHALGRTRRAADLWERLAEQLQGPPRAAALVARAGLLTGALGEPERAAELYRRALTDDPRNRDALDALAAIAEAQQQWNLLPELQERRFELARDPVTRAGIALAAGRLQLEELTDYETARVWFQRAADLDPEDPLVHRSLADLARETRDEAALAEALAHQIEHSGERPPVSSLLELASLLADAGRHEAALDHLWRAQRLSPDDALVLEALSESLLELGRHAELVDCLERRAALAATDPASCAQVLAELAEVQERHIGDAEAARRSFERAMQADPTYSGVSEALERLYRKTEAWQPLRGLLEQAGRSGPVERRAASLCALGELLLEHFDERAGAAGAFEAALTLDASLVVAHRGRQRLASESGDPDAMLAAYESEAAATPERSRLAFLVREMAELLLERDRREDALGWAMRWIDAAPEDIEALRLGARLQHELGQAEQQLALLERLDPLLQSAEQAPNRRSMAALHRDAGREEAAIAALRSAVEADPADTEAWRQLVAGLEEGDSPEELALARHSLVELLPAEERAGCLDALATLFEERLGDLPAAVDALLRLAETPGAPDDVENRLEALFERTARYEELAERAERRLETLPQGPEARDLGLRRAAVLLEHLSDFEAAVTSYRSISEAHPDCSEARAGLERALRAAGDSAGLATFLADEIESNPELAARERAALERAVILEEVLEDADEAIALYRWLAATASDARERARAAQRLEALFERAGNWEGLREHWQSALERAPEDEVAELHLQLGELCRHRLDDPEQAVAHYEAVASRDPGRAEPWPALATLHAAAGRHADLARVLEAQLASGTAGDDELALCSQLAELCAEPLDDPERALPHYQRVLELDPGSSAAGEFLIGHWESNGRHDEMARVLEARLSSLDAQPRDEDGRWAAERTSLRLRIAGLRAQELDDPDGAIAILEPALGEIGPRAVVAEPLADLYERIGYSEDLIELCQQAADAADAGAERAGWYARLAGSLRASDQLGRAAEAWRNVLDERPEDSDATEALRDLYRQLGEAEPLALLLDAELVSLSGPDEIPVRLELASLLTGPLGRPADALGHLRRVVHIDPGHAEALERGLELAEQLDRSEVTVELLHEALRRPQPPTTRAALLTRRGHLLSRDPGRTAEALADYRTALGLEPGRSEVRQALRRLQEETGDWQGVLDSYHQEACHAPEEERASLFERAADTAWQHLGPEAARPWLERLRRALPEDAGVLARLAELHGQAGRPVARLRALADQLELAREALTRRDLLLAQARLLERDLDAPGRAAAALERARELRPRDTDVLRELDRLYRELGRHRERADVLEDLATISRDNDRVSLLCEAASTHAGPLRDPQQAARLLHQALAETPRTSALRGELLRTLGDALRRTGPAAAWARCAEEELAALDPTASVFDERRLELRRELAGVYERGGRLDAALRHLRRLADDAPPDFDPEGELGQALLRGLRAQSNWVELERRLAVQLEQQPEHVESWLELARLRDEKLSATASAAEAYRRALDGDTRCLPALRGLRGAAERLGDWEQVAQSLEWELEHPETRQPEARSALLRCLGDVCWERLRSTTRASRSYAAALEANPDDFAAHRSLERLLEAMEDWRGALDLYESEMEVLGEREPERRRQVWLRAGEIARDHTEEPERALRAYAAAAELGELEPARCLERAELHERCGQHDAFAEVFARWCDDPAAGAGAHDLLRLAETLDGLGRREQAIERTRSALDLDAREVRAWDQLARLLEADGAAAAAAEAFERAAGLLGGPEAAERLLRAATLCEAEDLEAAESLLRRGVEQDPASVELLLALARLCDRRAAHEVAEEAAGRALDLCDAEGPLDTDTRFELAMIGGRAALARTRPDAAADFFGAALSLRPDDCDALARTGEARTAAGDLEGAREVLERLLTRADDDPARARHRALLARCLAEAGDAEAALEQCELALAEDPAQRDAHELAVSLHEASEDLGAGRTALERWATSSTDPAERAELLERAASWELGAGGSRETAECRLREALEADASRAGAWAQLAELLWDDGRAQDAAAAAAKGAEHADSPDLRSRLALLRGRALERQGEREPASDAYAEAADLDPSCIEAAIGRARLLRGSGAWREAAEGLEAFAARHPGDDAHGLAEVLQQLGRLLAGPLEDLEAAVAVYRRAVELEPDDLELRTTLAQLLSHRPEDWEEALRHHRGRLERDPVHLPSLRSALRIARERGRDDLAADGLATLAALGAASDEELAQAAPRLAHPLTGAGGLEDPLGEKLREALQKVAREVGEALEATSSGSPPAEGDGVAAFRAAALEAESRLTAPGLVLRSADELRDIVNCLMTLTLESDDVQASGAVLNALSAALGRRARRRLRRVLEGISLADVQALDFAAWRSDLRALAAATALDETDCSLRTALLALVCESADRSPQEFSSAADLTPLVGDCPEARTLLRRAHRAWLAEV